MTPCADTTAVASCGIVKVLTDARTTLAQALDAMLTSELTDVAAWEMLSELARSLGHEALAKELLAPIADERRHLENVRRWLTASTLGDAGAKAA